MSYTKREHITLCEKIGNVIYAIEGIFVLVD